MIIINKTLFIDLKREARVIIIIIIIVIIYFLIYLRCN